MRSSISPTRVHPERMPGPSVLERRVRRRRVASDIDEAFEMRLLGQIARWDDQAAFEQIYERYHGAVQRVALQVCRNASTAEEIVQQTFIALWIRAERLADKSVRLRPWLSTVARNAAIDRVRGERFGDQIEEAATVVSSEPTPEAAALAGEAGAEVRALLALLSAEQRAAVEMVYFAGMTYDAAAQALGEPVGTIKSRVRLALGHLRTQFTR